jgi:uncharacterized protein involved in exopolysaccharide biosynthesis
LTEPKRKYWWRKSTFLAINFFAVLLIALLTVFFFKPQYTAKALLLRHPTSLGFQDQFNTIAQVIGLKSKFGNFIISFELYQNILGSREFQQKLFHKPFTFTDHGKKRTTTLLQYLNITGKNEKEIFEKAYKKFNDDILYLHNDELDGALSVEITLPNAELAAKVANAMIEQLKKQVLAMIESERDEKLRFIRQKIGGVKAKMDLLDKRLEQFLATTKDPTLPKNQVRRMRIEREIKVQTAVLTELKKQEEMFLLQQLPILKPVWVLDSAVAPYQSSRPKRILLFISLATIFFFLEFLFFNLKASLSDGSRNKQTDA